MAFMIDAIRNFFGENFGGAAANLGTSSFAHKDTPNLSGKVAVVTGGSEGIGFAVMHTLLQHDISKLYMLSLSEEKSKNAKVTIADGMGQTIADKIVWMQCDLSNWTRVEEVAQQIKESSTRLDILINNAGRGIMSYQLTDYGVDRHMALNHIGHAVLTSQLLPLMKTTASHGSVVRIVNMSSNLHTAVPADLKFKSLEDLNQDLGPKYQYGRSKLAAILYARHFDRTVTQKGYPNILMNATHPGVVSTKQSKDDIHEAYPVAGYGMSTGFEPFKKSTSQGALSMLFAATTTEKSGQYICPPATVEPGSEPSQDEKLGNDLMDLTRSVVKLKTDRSLVV